jgi:L-ribulose-5-phosphate 4-epimerase
MARRSKAGSVRLLTCPRLCSLQSISENWRRGAHAFALGDSLAQAGREIPCFRTTPADYFRGAVPATDRLKREEIEGDYEWNTGHAIVRRFAGVDPLAMRAVVAGHAPFCWGTRAADASHVAWMLEEVAQMAFQHWPSILAPNRSPMRFARNISCGNMARLLTTDKK